MVEGPAVVATAVGADDVRQPAAEPTDQQQAVGQLAEPQPVAREPQPAAAQQPDQQKALLRPQQLQQKAFLPDPALAEELPPKAPLPLPPMAAPAKPKPPRFFQPPATMGSYAAGGHVVALSAADAVYATPAGFRHAATDQE